MDMLEPTADELHIAWNICIQLQDIPGAGTGALIDLKRIRDRKTTWSGKSEIYLMFALDNYLRNKGYGL